KNGNKIKPVITNEINLKESKKIIHKDNVQLNRVYFAWHSDKGYGNDDAALDILADILAGSKNSRLYKKLVHEMQIAQDVSAFQYSAKYNGVFFIIISLAKNEETENVKEYLLEEIKKVVKKGITKKELERALNGYKSSYIYSLQNLDNLVNQINNYNCNLNEPNSFLYDLNRYNKLELNEITWVAEKYLMKNFIELDIIPK
ncbi:MAG: insulinase family protein, partial [Ignavibacteriae bacterium]|nr:insulinase family protein [Ignavibacteriota bacterium]